MLAVLNHYTVIFIEFSALKVSVIVINDSKQYWNIKFEKVSVNKSIGYIQQQN